jgi:hypothetical protein
MIGAIAVRGIVPGRRTARLRRGAADGEPASLGVLVLGLAAAVLLALGALVHPPDQARAYRRAAADLLDRYAVALARADARLAEVQANPSLSRDPGWLAADAAAVAALETEERAAAALPVPPAAGAIQACIGEALRLSTEGRRLLHDAFQADGHHAYYLGSHGNWDLALGARRLAACRALLTAGPG